jgi:hypothetical protein
MCNRLGSQFERRFIASAIRPWRLGVPRCSARAARGIGGFFLYLLVAFTIGLMTLRNGHGWMFFFGIFFPILWIFGAFMPPPEMTATAH